MRKEDNDIEFQKALKDIQGGNPLLGKEGVLPPLIEVLTNAAIEGELESPLAQEITANSRNDKTKSYDSLEINSPWRSGRILFTPIAQETPDNPE